MQEEKIRRIKGIGWSHWCPGCEEYHLFSTDKPNSRGAKWSFDGNEQKPSFAPSMKISVEWSKTDAAMKDETCHYFLTEGKLNYLPDTTHEFSGRTIDLPNWKLDNSRAHRLSK